MKRVAILVETSLASGRQILNGISRFMREQNGWLAFHQTGSLGTMKPSLLHGWSGDGIIARIADRTIMRLVRSKRVPFVDALGNLETAGFYSVVSDDEAIAHLVATHFFEARFRHFAFFGLKNEKWAQRRRDAFATLVEGFPSTTFSAFEISRNDLDHFSWADYLRRLCDWIRPLPKPLALMVCSDQLASAIVAACREVLISIPEEVAIVGVDNDPPFCDLCSPRLSSVEPDHELIGYEAARLLDRLMQGGSPKIAPIIIPPKKLHLRGSSDVIALEEPALVKAFQLIRTRACMGLKVNEVARSVGLSRSVLQRRFHQMVGQTVFESMLAVRLARAKEMLADTRLPLAEVADKAGFKHQEYLGYVMRRKIGMTPAQFRKRVNGKS